MVSKKEKARQARRLRYLRDKQTPRSGRTRPGCTRPGRQNLQVTSASVEMQALCAVAESVNLEVRDVPGDGDCMFHALSLSLRMAGVPADSTDLRRIVSDFLRTHPNIADDNNFPRFLPSTHCYRVGTCSANVNFGTTVVQFWCITFNTGVGICKKNYNNQVTPMITTATLKVTAGFRILQRVVLLHTQK